MDTKELQGDYYCPFCGQELRSNKDTKFDRVISITGMSRIHGSVNLKVHLSCMEGSMTERQIKCRDDSTKIREWNEEQERLEREKRREKEEQAAFFRKKNGRQKKRDKLTDEEREQLEEFKLWREAQRRKQD